MCRRTRCVAGSRLPRPGCRCRSRVTTVAGGSSGTALHFAQLVINAGRDHKDAMLFCSKSTEPFRVCDLPGLRAAQQTELARTLILSGFLVRLPDD